MFQCSQQIWVVCSCELYCVFPAFLGHHRKFYCEGFCIQRHGNRVAHPVLSSKQWLSESRCYKTVPGLALFFPKNRKFFLCTAFSVFIGCSHSILWHKPRIPSQKFNMCDFVVSTQDFVVGTQDFVVSTRDFVVSTQGFVASTQAFVAKAEIACEYWCLYIERHRTLLRVLLTHV